MIEKTFAEHQRRRWMRPNAHLWIRLDAYRFMPRNAPRWYGKDAVRYFWTSGLNPISRIRLLKRSIRRPRIRANWKFVQPAMRY